MIAQAKGTLLGAHLGKNDTVKIIGAGVAGLTVAAELIDRGFLVELHEKADAIGAQSCSRYAGGMLAPWCERENAEEPVARLGARALDWWDRHVPGVVRAGSLVVANPRDVSDLTRFSRRTDHYEWVETTAIDDLEPSLNGRFKRGLFFKDEGHLDPRDALKDLADYIEKKAGKIHLGSDGRLSGDAKITIDTTGYAAKKTLPHLRGVKGEMLIIRTSEITLSRPVRLLHPRIPLYIVPRADHHFMIGATMIESGERSRITARSMIELLSGAYALHPAFGEAEIVEIGTDVRPAFDNNLPRIEKHGDTLHLNGLYRHGFLLAPALAQMAADMIEKDARPELFHAPPKPQATEATQDDAHRERADA